MQCHLAAHLHLPPAQVRRLPLALANLWCNYAAQIDGLETWWPCFPAAADDPAEPVADHIARLRAAAAADPFADDPDAPGMDPPAFGASPGHENLREP